MARRRDPVAASPPTAPSSAPATRAGSDEDLVQLWLARHRNSPRTVSAYGADAAAFLRHVGKPLRAVTLADVQDFDAALAAMVSTKGGAPLSPASRARRLSAVKSLFAFAHRLGYLAFDVGAPVKLPPVEQALAKRILSEEAVIRLLALEGDRRNHAMLRLLYLGGLRVSELCGVRVRDLAARNDGAGQVTVFGKGGKTRTVLLGSSMWQELAALRGGDTDPGAPLFRSRKGAGRKPLDPSAVHRVVKAAAQRAGLPGATSAHWLRHAHVSHALDNGAPAHLVQATVGHASLATTSRYAHARPNDSSARYLRG